MTVLVKTICIHCKHHNGASRKATWYDHKCLHPDLQRKKEQDPVTGVMCYADSLGVVYDEPSPNCRDINRGNCEYFQSKRGFKWAGTK